MLQWTFVSTLVVAVWMYCTHWILIVRDSTGKWKEETASLQKILYSPEGKLRMIPKALILYTGKAYTWIKGERGEQQLHYKK